MNDPEKGSPSGFGATLLAAKGGENESLRRVAFLRYFFAEKSGENESLTKYKKTFSREMPILKSKDFRWHDAGVTPVLRCRATLAKERC